MQFLDMPKAQSSDKSQTSQAQFLEKLEKFGLMHFRRALDPNAHIRFMTVRVSPSESADSVAGIGVTGIDEKDVANERLKLIAEGVALCKEIAASTRLRTWRRRLSTVWLRA